MIDARFEVDLLQAMFMLEVPEEVLGRLVEEKKLRTRRVDGTIYFLRSEIEQLRDRQGDEARSKGAS
ncbi:MAG: hypothetical protein WAN12_18825 [Candidatus Acidiferrum sp.]